MSDDNRFTREAETTEADRIALAGLILELRGEGLSDLAVLSAIETIPRRLFLDQRHRPLAYRNAALPIECGQTISAPAVVALMTEALALLPHHRVLEIGTGSGYQTAILSQLAGEVVSIERYRSLALLARERLDALAVDNVRIEVGDGTRGDPVRAPFDRIILTAGVPAVPPALIDQLAEGGLLVAPVGERGRVQRLEKVAKGPAGTTRQSLATVRFPALEPGVAETL